LKSSAKPAHPDSGVMFQDIYKKAAVHRGKKNPNKHSNSRDLKNRVFTYRSFFSKGYSVDEDIILNV
jgi:hypothetical protein